MAGTGGDGRGDRLYIQGVDLSGDASEVTNLTGGWETVESTPVDVDGVTRTATRQRGALAYTAWFNTARAHPVLSALPLTDVIATYIHGTDPTDRAAGLVAKQADYPASRGADGSLTVPISLLSTGSTLEWGRGYVAGLTRTDTASTNGAGVDDLALTNQGLSAYLHVTAFTGATATVTIQHSTDNGVGDPWTTVLDFAAVTTGPTAQRVTTNLAAVKRWLRVNTAGTFTVLTFHVMASRLGGLILGSGVAVDIQIFTTSGTWTQPAGGQTVTSIFAIGGGGGGGGGAYLTTDCSGGAGGGGGASVSNTFRTVDLAATESVTVGAGGTGGAGSTVSGTAGVAGTNGGNTLFGTTPKITALPGYAGAGGDVFISGGGAGAIGNFSGSPGANGPLAASGVTAVNSTNVAAAGGGSGGGCQQTPINAFGGGFGGGCQQLNFTGTGTAGGIRGAGGNAGGATPNTPVGGQGGGGGGSSKSSFGPGGAGGNGGIYGGGGGGGGAGIPPGKGSGNGGNGASGLVLVISW